MGVVNECIPYYEPGRRLPCVVRTGKTVVGKRLVIVGADMAGDPNALSTDVSGQNFPIEPAPAAAKAVLGVASHNAAEKKKVTVIGPGAVVPVLAGEALVAGELVGVGAEGKIVKAVLGSAVEVKDEGKYAWKVPPIGMVLADTAEGVDAPIRLS